MMKLDRQWFIPKGAIKVADKQSDAVAYLYTHKAADKVFPAARVFFGNQSKPVIHCYFTSEAKREAEIERAFDGRRKTMAFKAERRIARASWVPTYKVGDIFRTSWGYDQTNVEYFQIVEIKGKQAVLREICQNVTETGWNTGTCSPIAGKFIEPRHDGDNRGRPIRRLMQEHGIKIDDVRMAWLVKGDASARWSSYA